MGYALEVNESILLKSETLEDIFTHKFRSTRNKALFLTQGKYVGSSKHFLLLSFIALTSHI